MRLAASLLWIAVGFGSANAQPNGTPCSGQIELKSGQEYVVADGRACHFVLTGSPARLILRAFSAPKPQIQIDGKDANVPVSGNNYTISLAGLAGKRVTVLGEGGMDGASIQFELQTFDGISSCPADKEIHRLGDFALGPLALAYYDRGARYDEDAGSVHCLTTN